MFDYSLTMGNHCLVGAVQIFKRILLLGFLSVIPYWPWCCYDQNEQVR